MFRFFIIPGLLVLNIFLFYSTRKDRDTEVLKLSKLDTHSNANGANLDLGPQEGLYEENSENANQDHKKTELKEISMSPQEIEQLKLSDFHAFLRHEDRVIRQADASTTDYVLTPEQQKEIAKERLAIRLIDQLALQKTQ